MTKRAQLGALTLVIGLLGGGALAFAEPKPAPAKPAPARPAAGPAACEGAACDADKTCPHCGMKMSECMMSEGGAKLDVTVAIENTKQGATLKITAKNAADAPKVQAMAQKMAKHMEDGSCPMMHGRPGPGAGHPHGHMHGGPKR